MSKFNIGDRVVGVENDFSDGVTGKVGTIVTIQPSLGSKFLIAMGFDGMAYGVEFDDEIEGGHTCFKPGAIRQGTGPAKDGHGWFVFSDEIELLDADADQKEAA